MVYAWRCTQCGFVVWAGGESSVVDAVRSHLLDQHEVIAKEGFQVGWRCPFCGESRIQHDREAALEAFDRHLGDHVGDRIRSGIHVADEVDRTGNVLVLAPTTAPGADNARIHFLAPADLAIVVTSAVTDRLSLLAERRSRWPAHTIVLTTSEPPYDGLEAVDTADASIELVQLSKHMSLAEIGETISRVVAEHDRPGQSMSVQFDVLSELVATCELKELFHFLHLLTARFESAGALAHYYCDPDTNATPTINLLAELFDLTVRAEGDRFRRIA